MRKKKVWDTSYTDGTFVYRRRRCSCYFPYFGCGHVASTSVVTPHSCHDGLFQATQQLLSLCSFLQMLSLPANSLFELLQLVVRLMSPQVLQPLGS